LRLRLLLRNIFLGNQQMFKTLSFAVLLGV